MSVISKKFILAGITLISISLASHADPSSHNITISPESAYIIISAENANKKGRQPDWLAIRKRHGKKFHFPTKQSIFQIEPGRYSLLHIDFGESYSPADKSVRLESPYTFTFKAGTIYLIGRLEMRRHVGTYKTTFIPDRSLIRKACEMAPNLFTHFPVKRYDSPKNKTYYIDCKKEEAG